MSEQPKLSVLQRVLLTITREEDEEKLLEIYDSMHLPICFQGRGQGTAPSELLDIFGLRGTGRLLTACILPKFMVPSALEALHQKLSFRQRGGGIAITVPVSGMQNHVMQMLNEEARNAIQQQEKGDESQMKEKSEFSLIWVSVASGYSDDVVDAARAAGARGGTVMKGRRRNSEHASQYFGISLQEEQEFVMIVVPREKKCEIMLRHHHLLRTENPGARHGDLPAGGRRHGSGTVKEKSNNGASLPSLFGSGRRRFSLLLYGLTGPGCSSSPSRFSFCGCGALQRRSPAGSVS